MTTHLPRLTLQGKARFFFDRSIDRSRSRLRITRAGQKERSTPNPSLTKDRSFDQDLYGRLRSYPTVVTSYFRTTEIARSVDAGFRLVGPRRRTRIAHCTTSNMTKHTAIKHSTIESRAEREVPENDPFPLENFSRIPDVVEENPDFQHILRLHCSPQTFSFVIPFQGQNSNSSPSPQKTQASTCSQELGHFLTPFGTRSRHGTPEWSTVDRNSGSHHPLGGTGECSDWVHALFFPQGEIPDPFTGEGWR